MHVVRIILLVLFLLVSVTLIALVVSQTSKHEGLGAVGGSSGPSLRGRAGLDEKLSEYTKYCAFAFMALAVVLYLLNQKFGDIGF
jgi:protein translocase SecG subunit